MRLNPAVESPESPCYMLQWQQPAAMGSPLFMQVLHFHKESDVTTVVC